MLSPYTPAPLPVYYRLRLITPVTQPYIRGNSVSAVTSSALCPLLPVFSQQGNQASLHGFLKPSKPRGPSPRKSYAVSHHHRYYGLIRRSDRLPPISLPRLYRRSLAFQNSSCLSIRPSPLYSVYLSPVATTHTPESVSGALAYSFPDPIGHREIFTRLALSSFPTSIGFAWRGLSTLQCSLYAAAPGVAQLPCRPEPPLLGKAQRAFYFRACLGLVTSS
jgi:hypothetical protein